MQPGGYILLRLPNGAATARGYRLSPTPAIVAAFKGARHGEA
jgi:hypothetical protein